MPTVKRPSSSGPVTGPVDHLGRHGAPAEPDRSPLVSASLTGADGSVQLRVSRRVEAPGDGVGPDLLVLCVAGAVDLDTAGLFRMALLDSVAGHPRVCCDLRDVTFFAAAGVNTLVEAADRAAALGCRLSVRGACGVVLRVLQITGLDRLVTGEA